MESMIEQATRNLKSRLEMIVREFSERGLSPESLSELERDLRESLGEVGRRVEEAVLEASDIDQPAIDIASTRYYQKYQAPQE